MTIHMPGGCKIGYTKLLNQKIETYFQYYDGQTDEDKKFRLMEILIHALTDIECQNDFDKKIETLKTKDNQEF